MAQVFPIHAAFFFDGNKITDHNRSAISINPERIENRRRMADGTLRVFFIAQKQEYKVGWKNLPALDEQTADGFWGADSLKSFYEANKFSSFVLRLNYGDGSYEEKTVMFKSFSTTLTKRNSYINAYYDVDLSVEEV